MTNSASNIAFNVGTPTVAGPNGGFINGTKFTGPSKSGKFWIAATSASAKPGSTREPNSKEKGELLAAFHTAIAANGVTANAEQDAWVKVVDAANTKTDKPATTEGKADTGGEGQGAGEGGNANADDAGGDTPGAAAEAGASTDAGGDAPVGRDFSGGSDAGAEAGADASAD